MKSLGNISILKHFSNTLTISMVYISKYTRASQKFLGLLLVCYQVIKWKGYTNSLPEASPLKWILSLLFSHQFYAPNGIFFSIPLITNPVEIFNVLSFVSCMNEPLQGWLTLIWYSHFFLLKWDINMFDT